MYQIQIPEYYRKLSIPELQYNIQAIKEKLGNKCVILAHHYQRPEIVELSNTRGDSLQLARFAAENCTADFIIFCGVHFMAETADILKSAEQRVILPDLGAGCDLADAADADDVQRAWDELVEKVGHDDILPISYVNSTAALKAFVGSKNGIICTSSNATKIVEYALKNHKLLFFFPDEHLGRNTAKKLGIPLQQMALWDFKKRCGGLSEESITDCRVLLWKGACPVHQMFSVKQADNVRAQHPDCKIIVHPECAMEVVDKADFSGSTDFIVKTIANSPAGSIWVVGTELNLVNRIALENPDKTVLSLNPFMCLCGTMNRIDLPHLYWALDNIYNSTPQNIITVHEPERSLAKIALNKMLEMSI